MNAAIDKLIESSNGRFLTIKFLKDNGEVRTLNGRVGVRWGNVPSSYRRDSKHRKFYLIYVPHKGYGFYPISTDGLKRAENFRSCRATLRRIRGL